ncbi:MAG: isoprenyl transferase [Clostridiales bacterium]|nr:isoprenyl transferase [Clostridiales bacterium]
MSYTYNRLLKKIKQKDVPQHVAIIMDGNGRWAKMHKLSRSIGHKYGVERMKELLRVSKDAGIKYVTVYAFSTENWKRSSQEVGALMKLAVDFINRDIDEIASEGAKITILGDISALPEETREAVEYAVKKTEKNDELYFNVALNYGGRAEIVRAVKKIAEDVKNGVIDIDCVSEQTVSDNLFTAGMPDPDLIIRTAGEFRLSNFLPYQSAYSEIWISDPKLLWPDFAGKYFLKAIYDYQQRDRRFGAVK